MPKQIIFHILISLLSYFIVTVTVCYSQALEVECEEYPIKVLEARMQDGCLPTCDIVKDIVGFSPTGAALQAEALTAGFPCQVCFSVLNGCDRARNFLV